MSHTHIGPGDWACIGRMLRAGHSLRGIARTIGKDVGSVSRHVKEYGGRDEYDGREVRRKRRMKRIDAMQGIRIIKGSLLRFIKQQLKLHKSPEQIAGILKNKKQSCDTRTIYRYIDERAPHLKMYLRSQKGKYRRKHGTKKREKAREQGKNNGLMNDPRLLRDEDDVVILKVILFKDATGVSVLLRLWIEKPDISLHSCFPR